MTKTPPSSSPASSIFPPWNPIVAVLVAVGIYIGASLVGQILVEIYLSLTRTTVSDKSSFLFDPTLYEFLYVAAVEAATILLLYLFIRSYKFSFKGLGLIRPRLKDIGVALVGVPVYVLGYIILLALSTALFPSIDVEQKQQLGFEPTGSQIGLILTFISLVVLPPLVEEIIVRGFLFVSLLKRLRFWIAALLASAIFASAHLQFGSGQPLLWVAAIDTFVLSIVLCYMRYKTGSLWPGIILHAIKNGVAFFSIFIFKLV